MRYVVTVIVTVVILAAVLWPGSQIPSTKLPIDKLVHFVLFTAWSSAIIFDFNVRWVKALIGGLLFALLTEVIQIPLEKRSFDVMDLLADSAGVGFGIINSSWIIRLAKKVLRR